MPQYLDPTGRSTYGIAICGRCGQKFFLDELSPDPNSPGLMVCMEDRDDFDPYRLPARQAEDISLPFTRPDSPLAFDADGEVTFVALATETSIALATILILTENGQALETEEV